MVLTHPFCVFQVHVTKFCGAIFTRGVQDLEEFRSDRLQAILGWYVIFGVFWASIWSQ